jgi:predicted unusual protein kinase regulating ubiquinone biosynthesis (AarF/ABC1/UbiB family)
MKAAAVTMLGTCEYLGGRKLGMPRDMVIDHTVRRVRQGGVLSIKLAQSVANRRSLIDDDRLTSMLSDMQCVTTYDQDGRARHEASIAVVTQCADGRAIKTLRDDAVLGDLADLRRAESALRALSAPAVLCDTLAGLVDEIDMTTERAKYLAFSASLRGRRSVVVPRVYESSSTRVVMDYVPSVLVKDLKRPVPLQRVNAFFSDVALSAFGTGVFHLDLHAGNVGCGADGAFVVYDMGSVYTVPEPRMRRMGAVLLAASEHAFFDDWSAVKSALLRGGVMVKVEDAAQLRLLSRTISRYASGGAPLETVVEAFKTIRGGVVAETDVSRIMQCVALLEGTCKLMNPAFLPYGAVSASDLLRAAVP